LEIGKIVLDLVLDLINTAIGNVIEKAAVSFFTRRKIIARIENATAEVIEPMLPFLSVEGVREDYQKLMVEVIVAELKPIAANPAILFQGSLDGQKIFDQLYSDKPLPQTITDRGLKDIYALIFPRIATLLCKIPAAVEAWEAEAWSENFRRFDEISSQLRSLFGKVDSLTTAEAREADEVLTLIRRALAQKIGLELDLTGLRADRPLAGKFDDFFVLPEFSRVQEDVRDYIHLAPDVVAQFVSSGSFSIVIGAPGAGKSTWTKWLQREGLTRETIALPIRIELRNLSVDSLPATHELIRSVAGKHLSDDVSAQRISQWLREKRIWFILDGFDEIRPSERDAVIDWISEIADASRSCPVILTSRPLTTDQFTRLSKSWKLWSIEPFDDERIVDYIGRWYRYTPLIVGDRPDIDPASLANTWSSDPTLQPLTSNPLLLSTLLTVHHLDGRLPAGRAQLYRRYVDGMLGVWDDRRHVSAAPVELTVEQKRQILRALAIEFFDRQVDEMDEGELTTWLRARLDLLKLQLSPEVVMGVLRERTGLLVGPGIYNFAHKTISEFLVADAIVQGDHVDKTGSRFDRFMLFANRDDDRWNTVTFLWAGLAPVADVIAFIDQCAEVGAASLGAGILADQYERINRVDKSRLIESILPAVDYTSDSYSVPQPSGLSRSVEIPNRRLRSLTGTQLLHNLIQRACADEIIDVGLIKRTPSDKARHLLIMAYISITTDCNAWRQCVSEPLPAGIANRLWDAWVIQNVCFKSEDGNEVDISELLRIYTSVRPDAVARVQLVLLGSICVMNAWRRSPLEIPENLLSLLLGADYPPPSTDDLCSTRHWMIETIDDADLLEKSLRYLSQAPTTDSMVAARAYVSALISRRECECPVEAIQPEPPEPPALPPGTASADSGADRD